MTKLPARRSQIERYLSPAETDSFRKALASGCSAEPGNINLAPMTRRFVDGCQLIDLAAERARRLRAAAKPAGAR